MDALPCAARRAAQHPRYLFDRQVQVVVEAESQEMMLREPVERGVEVSSLCPTTIGDGAALKPIQVGESQHPPPPTTPRRPALVGDDRQEPRPQLGSGPESVQLPPRLQRGLLDGILRRGSVIQHRHSQPEGRIEHRRKQVSEGAAVARPRLLEVLRVVVAHRP